MTPFYIERTAEDRAWLGGEEARHCIKVLRKKPGDSVVAVDGNGYMYECRVVALGKDVVELQVDAKHEGWGEKSLAVKLAISPLHKPDRLEWLIEKAVELGVTEIIPYIGKHTVKTGFRHDRLERIMIAALKQSMRSKLPVLHEPINFRKMLSLAEADVKLIGNAETGKRLEHDAEAWDKVQSISILIGPEGDFAEEELVMASESGFKPVFLGTNRLRSETAAMHFLGIVKYLTSY